MSPAVLNRSFIRLALSLGALFCFSITFFSNAYAENGLTHEPASQSVEEETVYKWMDSSGKTHYSNNPSQNESEAIALPEVGRYSSANKIQRLKDSTPPTCTSHGGIDCSRGEDVDGSVICYDGFDGSSLSYQVHCNSVRLEAEFLIGMIGRLWVRTSLGECSSELN